MYSNRPYQPRDQSLPKSNNIFQTNFPPSTQGRDYPNRGRGRQKRSCNNRGSFEQDNKKRTVDTDFDNTQSSNPGEHHVSSLGLESRQNIGQGESDSSLSDASSIPGNTPYPNVRAPSQKTLNKTRGTSSPQINKGGKGLEPSSMDPTKSLNAVNLSSYSLTQAEVQVLSKGLSFCLHQNFDHFEIVTDLHLFAHKLLLKC